MKPIVTFLFLLVYSATFAQYNIKTDSVYITGTVSNFEKYKETANSVRFIVNDIVLGNQTNHRAKINNDGTYKIAIYKIGTEDIYIEYNDDLETIIVSPGDRIQVNFDAGDLEKSLTFKGDDARINADLKAFEAAFDKENTRLYGAEGNSRFKVQQASEKDNGPEAHKKMLTARLIKDEAFLKAYAKQHKLSPAFTRWEANTLKCEYYSNLFRYTWLHPMYNKTKQEDFKIPDSYFSFIKDVPLKDPALSESSNYNYFLGDYRRHIRQKAFGNSAKVDSMLIRFAKEPAFAADIMISNELFQMIDAKYVKEAGEYIELYKKLTKYKAIRDYLVQYYTEALNKLNSYKLPANAQINTTPQTEADSVFNKLVSRYANKVVYVDIWATWCGPCRAEMPNSAALREKYKGKDVVFLYLGVQSEEKTWKALIAELDIQGEHFLLNKNEFAAVSEKFQVNGIPHYMLVNKKGQVFDGNAKRPGDEKLAPEIDQLLEEK
ncbi:TlpA disulfide reductase family protein [Mucilaginibacter gynuensis]|uniref:TlpA disulfide reductase family protein n=1 Tax=Mucilaginibacter gynuensis TaxID=1302236 RepID=A0ABP8HMB8_9SPHI